MPTIDTLRPVTRQQGTQIPNLSPTARWIDSVALVAGVAKSYTLPTDIGGAKAEILGLSATDGPVYGNFTGAAIVNVADSLTGVASLLFRTDAGASYLITVPQGATALSLICANACVVTLEAWR
jgi:hypothetical protein